MKNKHRIMSGSMKKIVLGGPREEEARRVLGKAIIASLKVVFAFTKQKKVQAVSTADTQAEARNGKERGRKVLIRNLVLQPLKHPVKNRIISPGNQTIGMMVLLVHLLCVVHLHGMAREIPPGRHQFPLNLAIRHMLFWILVVHGQMDRDQPSVDSKNMHCTLALRQNFCTCNKSFVFANSATGTCLESCIIYFPTTPPCSTRVDVLETGNVPILFSLPR